MHTPFLAAIAITMLSAASGCSSSTSVQPTACTAGSTQACLCVGGGSGVQSCKDDGSGFSPCDCGGGPKDTSVDAPAVDSSLPDTTDAAVSDTSLVDGSADTLPADVGTDGGSTDSGGAGTYTDSYTKGVTSTAQCTNWNAWRKGLSATKVYTKITVKGSAFPTGKSCSEIGVSGPRADNLCQALRTGTATSESCGGDSWIVSLFCGPGGAVGLIINNPPCGCGTGYAVRPCIDSPDWGGLGGTTCGSESQTMTVICE